MNNEIVFSNARMITPDAVVHGSLHVRGGVIHELASGSASPAGAIDLDGDYLLPGLIDIHTDNLERHLLPRQSAAWPVMAALISHDAQLATAGITTVLDSLCVGTDGGGVRDIAKVEEVIELLLKPTHRDLFRVNHLLHLRAELNNADLPSMFERLHRHPDLRLVSLMDHTPGQRQVPDVENFFKEEMRRTGRSREALELQLEAYRKAHEANHGPNRRHLLSLLGGRGIALASHDDTTLEHVEEAHAEGIAISEFPTTFVAARAARERGMQIVAGGPNLVLGRSHSGNVSVAELAKAGLVDVLSSDYAPSSLLHGAFLLHTKVGLPLPQAIATVTANPAKLVSLDDRGAISPGRRADLIRVRLVDEMPVVTTVWRDGLRVA
jgi:alpha-D-ribose 1-methylphosphonate 5-triphosphate diphosphatase